MNKTENPYTNFIDNIEHIRSKAARFHRVDLHIHTIDSDDFPSIHDKEGFVKSVPKDEKELKTKNDKEKFIKKFKDHAKHQSLRLVAITDHNESDLAADMSLASDDELTILPGIEIANRTNIFSDSVIHILAIFPKDTTAKTIDKVFPASSNMPASGNRKGKQTNQNTKEILEIISSLGGISIAAHADSNNGVRTMVHAQNIDWLKKNYLKNHLIKKEKQQGALLEEEKALLDNLQTTLKPLGNEIQNAYLEFLSIHDFDAIQIKNPSDRQYYEGDHVDILGLAPFPCVVSSDAHTISDVGVFGYGTHIKMSDVSLSGIKKALKDPGTRIRFDDELPKNKPARLLGISFDGGSFSKETIGFSDNLSVLIGSRGSGKSALIEAIRFVLNQNINNLPAHLYKPLIDRKNFTLRDTEIKILYEDEVGERYILKRRINEAKTSCLDTEGNLLPEIDLPHSISIQAEIYGWSEIEELSDSSRKQLSLLDGTIDEELTLKLEVTQGKELLKTNSEAILSKARNIQNLIPNIQGGDELRSELSKLSTPALDEAFEERDKSLQGRTTIHSLQRKLTETSSNLINEDFSKALIDDLEKHKIEEKSIIDVFLKLLSEEEEHLQIYPWKKEFLDYIKNQIQDIEAKHYSLMKSLRDLAIEINTKGTLAQTHYDSSESNLNIAAEQSGQSDLKAAFSRRKEFSERLEQIESVEKEIDENNVEIERLFKERNEKIIPDINMSREKLFNARKEKARAIAKKLKELKISENIEINVLHLGDNLDYIEQLGYKEGTKTSGLLKGVNRIYLKNDYPGFFGKKYSPSEFVQFALDKNAKEKFKIQFIRNKKNGVIKSLITGKVVQDTESNTLLELDLNDREVNSWSSIDYEYIKMEDYEKIWNHVSPKHFEETVHEYYDPKKLEELLKLETSDIEDLIQIILDGRFVDELSPGERCSALIPIVLVEGTTPLIIDQPEDNLDNKRVFELVVDILRGLKEKRQIILSTHNPNIPVSGDAEQVIVFEAPTKDQCIPIEQNSIDNIAVIQQIKNIMEGGDKAFEMRIKKYNVLEDLKLK